VSELAGLEAEATPLVARAQDGDPVALADLLSLCRPWIYRWAVVDLGDFDEAEDTTQDVLVRLHSKLGRFRRGSRFTTWLFRVTRNAAVDRRRRWSRRLKLMARSDAMAAMAGDSRPAANPEAATLRQELDRIVRTFVAALPSRQRQVLDLVDLQGHAPSEVADLLDLDPGTVRAHLHRARRELRSRLLASHPEMVEGNG
jgi:RNA polymerase sigma-70 factor (ECF subfamily)